MALVRCAAGKCEFRTPDGKGAAALPAPRKKKGAPADKSVEQVSKAQQVYDAQSDATNKCTGDCRCYIVVKTTNTKTGGLVSEVPFVADGDDKDGFSKQDYDKILKNATDTGNRTVEVLAECLEVENNKDTGKKEPKHK